MRARLPGESSAQVADAREGIIEQAGQQLINNDGSEPEPKPDCRPLVSLSDCSCVRGLQLPPAWDYWRFDGLTV